ncbi:MAG: tetratricopeptide repeat protein [Elusimicrobiota bacterium]
MNGRDPEGAGRKTAPSLRRKATAMLLGAFFVFLLMEAGLRAFASAFSLWQEFRNRASAASDGTYRILCLGDSMTAGTYPKILEEILNRRDPGRRFAVIDKARGATDSRFVLANLERYLDEYKPHMLVVMMGSNDSSPHLAYGGLPAEEKTVFKTRALARILLRLLSDARRDVRLRSAIEQTKPAATPVCFGLKRDIQTMLGIGDFYLPQNRHDTARSVFERALAAAPQNARAYACLGKALQVSGAPSQAEQSYSADAHPRELAALVQLAAEYCSRSRWDEAETILGQALRLDPSDVPARLALGHCRAARGDYPRAEDAFLAAVDASPRNPDAWLGLARLHLDQGRTHDAERALGALLRVDPDNPEAYSALGECHDLRGESDEARRAFEKAAALDPGDYRHLLRLGSFFRFRHARHDLDRAIRFYESARETAPDAWRVYFELGAAYRQSGSMLKAERMFRKVIALNPGFSDAYVQAAQALTLRRGRAKAARDLNEAGRLRSAQPSRTAPPLTRRNYRDLREAVLRRGIRLVCVQYPMRSLRALEEFFDDKSGIVFVDNEKSFQEAVRRSDYWDYFIDVFGGNFGHCTPKGYRMLAQNIADAILGALGEQ